MSFFSAGFCVFNESLVEEWLFFTFLTLFRMGFFGAAHGWGGQKGPPLLKICQTYPTMINLGTVIPYPKKIQKMYESRDTSLKFC